MAFNSLYFALFSTVVFLVYWITPVKKKWKILLCANIFFYACSSFKSVLVLFVVSVFSYYAGKQIEEKQNKKSYLLIGITGLLFILYVFKYLNFSLSLVEMLLKISISKLELLLPLGISFYTFNSISYLVDIYNGEKAENNYLFYLTYISFFPAITSGPLVRYNDLINQIRQEKIFKYEEGKRGVILFAWGLFKKIVIADNISFYIDPVFANITVYKGFVLILTIVLYCIQIYADFSGYSDMAIGLARLLGITLPDNFKQPYFSTSIKEFWSRWHISLSNWLRDYIYIPLGGNKKGTTRMYINILIVFLISGIWHGASINYVIWGLLHGLIRVIENVLNIKSVNSKNTPLRLIRTLIVFFIICVTWIFFRCNSLSDSIYFLNPNNYVYIKDGFNYFSTGLNTIDVSYFNLAKILFGICIMMAIDYLLLNNIGVIANIDKLPKSIKWLLYISFGLLIIYFSKKGIDDFIYYKF